MRTIFASLFALLGAILLAGSAQSGDTAKDKEKADPPKGKAEEKKDKPKNRDLMLQKLKASQTILEALSLNDFAKLEKHGQELIEVSKKAEFARYKTPQYEMFTNTFRASAESLIKKAKDKNLEGATLAYVEMTVTCVKCHQHTREIADISLPMIGE